MGSVEDDPLSQLSDIGSCSSWSDEDNSKGDSSPSVSGVDWEQQCLTLQLELQEYKLHATELKAILTEKVRLFTKDMESYTTSGEYLVPIEEYRTSFQFKSR